MIANSLHIEKYTAICCLLFISAPVLDRLHIPGSPSIVSAIFCLVFLFFFKKKEFRKVVFSFPLQLWLFLTLYHCTNAIVKNVPEVDFFDYLHGMKIYACLGIFTYMAAKNMLKTVRSLLICFLLDILVIMAFSSFADGRLAGYMWSTQLGQLGALVCFYVAYLVALKPVSRKQIVLMYLLPVFFVLLTLSRNALAMVAFSCVATYWAFLYRRDSNAGKKLVFFSILVTFFVWVASPYLKDSEIATRAAETNYYFERSNTFKYMSTGTVFDKIVGDRLIYYVKGYEFFQKQPLTGIGMWNYMPMSGGIFPLHSEYMIHLCEGGVVGLTIYLIFLFYVAICIWRYKGPSPVKIVAFFSFGVLLFCGIYAREFYYEFFYPIYGIILSLRYQRTGEIEQEKYV